MGSKFRYTIIILFTFQFIAKAQGDMDFRRVDSLTYLYYQSGDWDNLIKLGLKAINQNIDYKFLRQRLGYAYFIKADYLEARKNFLKAYFFDSYDSFTLTYLYYSYLNSGKQDYAMYFAGRLPEEIRKNLPVKNFQLVESIDLEYNFKFAGAERRSNPQYYHLGLNSRIGSRVQLYQMVSNYKQRITIQYPGNRSVASDQQPEYFALLEYTISPHWTIKSAYHFLNTQYSTIDKYANLGLVSLSADFGHLNFATDASVFKIEQKLVKQSGIQAGVEISRTLNMYFTGKLSLTNQQTVNHIVYNQKVGFKVSKNAWIEGNTTFGYLKNYHDYDAIYVYNSVDATTFRGGGTLFIYSGKHLAFWANYSYERKEFYENILYHYNQFSYLGGIKWKL